MKTRHDLDEPLRCDICGRFVSSTGDDGGVRHMLTPDSDYSAEQWETLCKEHANFDAIDKRRPA